ncbi:hypothetical protein F5Y01DRAFT_268892 [Xylaria sp. FL0043]|nr:hypothetical protein F5Y01DRAFT_268892 [Xylaria sp. FL0043]
MRYCILSILMCIASSLHVHTVCSTIYFSTIRLVTPQIYKWTFSAQKHPVVCSAFVICVARTSAHAWCNKTVH